MLFMKILRTAEINEQKLGLECRMNVGVVCDSYIFNHEVYVLNDKALGRILTFQTFWSFSFFYLIKRE